MKLKYIKDFQEGENLHDEQFLLVKVKESKTKTNKVYYDIVLADKSGEIKGKIWENALPSCDVDQEENTIVTVSGNVSSYNNNLQITVNKLSICDDFDLSDFLQASAYNNDEMYEKLLTIIQSISDLHIKKLMENIFIEDSEFVKKFRNSFAGEKAHHNYLGGLMEHILEIFSFADAVCEKYPLINRSLLFAGIALHDIGKVFELEVELGVSRTREGHFLGHIAQGALFVEKNIEKVEGFPPLLREKLLHLILSHHGKYEWGSPVMPLCIEAIALHHLDNLSSKLNIVKTLNDNSQNIMGNFSDYNYLLESRFYIEKNDENEDSQHIPAQPKVKNQKVKEIPESKNEVPFISDEDMQGITEDKQSNEKDNVDERNLQIPF